MEGRGERGANYKEEVVNLHEMRHTISRKANEANTSKLSNWYSSDIRANRKYRKCIGPRVFSPKKR